jgi:AhpD family alkylhydroperoxidase
MGKILSRVTARGSLAQIRHVEPVRPDAARDVVAEVYAQLERDFGMFAPPVVLHSPAAGVLAASWAMLRETLVATGLVERALKETVATAVSLGNACPYCVEVHAATLHGLARTDDAMSIAGGSIESITDPEVRQIAAWARASGNAQAAARHDAPFSIERAPELVGVAITFHYLNRMVNVFLEESAFPQGMSVAAHDRLMRLVGRVMRPTVRKRREPGASVRLLPAAPLPDDMWWAAGAPNIAAAFARASAVIDAGGERSIPAPVRDLVTAELAKWDGRPVGPSRAWADDAVAGLPVAARSAGRLALLTALASYQVGQSVIDEFRRDHPEDATLVELTSWASLSAARRVGAWLRFGGEQPSELPGEKQPAPE